MSYRRAVLNMKCFNVWAKFVAIKTDEIWKSELNKADQDSLQTF